jgi:hypothetical protein
MARSSHDHRAGISGRTSSPYGSSWKRSIGLKLNSLPHPASPDSREPPPLGEDAFLMT